MRETSILTQRDREKECECKPAVHGVCVYSQFSSSAVHISLLEFCDTDEFPLILYENHKIQRFANARIRRIFAKRCEFRTVRVDKGTK